MVVMPADERRVDDVRMPDHPALSEVVNMVSPGSPQKMCFIDAASATA